MKTLGFGDHVNLFSPLHEYHDRLVTLFYNSDKAYYG